MLLAAELVMSDTCVMAQIFCCIFIFQCWTSCCLVRSCSSLVVSILCFPIFAFLFVTVCPTFSLCLSAFMLFMPNYDPAIWVSQQSFIVQFFGESESVSYSWLTGAAPSMDFCSRSTAVFRLWHVVRSGVALLGCDEWLFELPLPSCLKEYGHSPLTTAMSKVFLAIELPHTRYFFSFSDHSVNPRGSWVGKSQ